MNAEIIAVGTEILMGQIVNSNATYLSEQLADLGINVYYHVAVGDNKKRLTTCLERAKSRSDLIVLCGGLGPTQDDLTKQTVAKFVNQALVYDPVGHTRLVDYFAKTNREMTENNLLQVLTFKDGRGIANPNGLAVGIYYEDDDHTHYLLLPGPPRELKAMFRQNVVPILREINSQDTKLYSRVLRFYGIGESQLVTLLADLIDHQTNPTLVPYAKTNEVTLRLTANAPTPSQADVLLDALEVKIQELVGGYFYGYGDDFSLAEAMIAQLKDKNRTISVAESLTAGLFASVLGQYAGVSQVFKGGVVTYSLEMKADLLDIDADYLREVGTVSEACVTLMAKHMQKKAQTDYAIAFSGVAGPDKLEDQEVGTVWMALATPSGIQTYCKQFPHGRNEIRQAAVMFGLNLVYRALLAEE